MGLLEYKDVYNDVGEPVFNEKTTDELQQLAQIVCNNHFSYVGYHDREDLIYEGLVKGIELIRSCRFDPNFGAPLKNFVYTGMRNEMTNYLYAKKREYPVEEFYGDQNMSCEIEVDSYEIEVECVLDIAKRFIKRYGDYSGLLIDRLCEMGFSVVGDTSFEKLPVYNSTLLERMVVLTIWRIQESYH